MRRAKTFENMLNLAKEAETFGFHGAYLNDHVHGFADGGKEDYLEAWTTMTGIGVLTNKIRVGQIVLFNSLRNPAFLAKSIATLDNMTNGRYELLIGAGWNDPEYLGYDLMEGGRGMPSAKERVDRFEEAIQIIKLMLNNDVTNFQGKYWHLQDAINNPQPIQKPMRISVGCGKPRMMNITAKYGDGINISGRSLKRIEELVGQFVKIVKNQGKVLSDYYISGFGGIQIAKNQETVEQMAKDRAESTKMTVSEILNDQFIGTPEDLVTKIRKTRDLGMKMMVVSISTSKDLENQALEFFHDEVMTQL